MYCNNLDSIDCKGERLGNVPYPCWEQDLVISSAFRRSSSFSPIDNKKEIRKEFKLTHPIYEVDLKLITTKMQFVHAI